MSKHSEPFGIIYWGKKGGGHDLFHDLQAEAKRKGINFVSFPRPERKFGQNEFRVLEFWQVLRWLAARRRLLNEINEANIRSVLILMASPWDMFMGRQLLKLGVQVARVIHDATPHKGEFFPNRLWIRLLCSDCSKIITLSNFVAKQLTSLYRVNPEKIKVCEFPPPSILKQRKKSASNKNRVLLIGRGKKYQGQDLLEEAWKNMSHDGIELVIAGKGFKPSDISSGIFYKNWWMSRIELLDEIAKSDLVVFPYKEASQSGTIPICKAMGIPVVVCPVGGLPEQVNDGIDGIVAKDHSPCELTRAIFKGLKLSPGFMPMQYSRQDSSILGVMTSKS